MRMNWRSVALSSLLLLTLLAAAETRPRYGGVLRVEIAAPVQSLDPVVDPRNPAIPLLYDTLVSIDDSGKVKPALAVAWQQETDRRLRLTLRHGATFADGTAVTSAAIAGILRGISSDWTVTAGPEAIAIETAAPRPGLLAQLALPQNSIVLRSAQKIIGSGVFTVKDWQPGIKLVLQARQDA